MNSEFFCFWKSNYDNFPKLFSDQCRVHKTKEKGFLQPVFAIIQASYHKKWVELLKNYYIIACDLWDQKAKLDFQPILIRELIQKEVVICKAQLYSRLDNWQFECL